MCVEDQHALPHLIDLPVDIAPVRGLSEDVDLAELRIAVYAQCDAVGNDDTKVANVHSRAHPCLSLAELDVPQVDGQIADTEPVVAMQIVSSRDDVAPVADATADVHVEDRREE